jgi:circadian clock protein KaiC
MSDVSKTGIVALDEILIGGIPSGSSVIVAGSAGTGKTVLCQQFLFEGAKTGENGIYFSLVEPSSKMAKNLEGFKFYDPKIMDEGKVRIVDMTQKVRLQGLEFSDIPKLIQIIKSMVDESKAQRVVIDSLTALCENIAERKRIRDFILELGYELMNLKVTTLMISEIPPQTYKYSVYGVEEFIADGVILLSDFERKGDLVRTLQVIKMRSVAHSRNKQVMKILDDGITLIPMFKSEVE